ncbi:arsenate reductase (glutaredoxin) [Denitromonas ohlonensis]|uniref:Arsenate reductase n=2 Tax=Denitromonas TaxID=139331 RepID=A0A557SIR4_9RHOO|nr:arsenate reductase (glutaredoxin) [Denitromonas ohlonensis]TVO69130.1 arsenate reductase (glutaredoxin) [Denitromonas ohlonensis]TVO77230.1 arsenate reductase (glutaredoxin) [Denitromonas ohlonensis]TVT78146.1 MAG: arsenate reductase (glutaredoxin) [Denitromonas halophila]
MSDTITLLHNPRCSKSRAALALLQDAGADVSVLLYLDTPPSRDSLARIVAQLGITPDALIRRGEDIFKTHYQGKTLDADAALDALAAHPKLIERPIAIRGERAVIGRPPEKVLELLD